MTDVTGPAETHPGAKRPYRQARRAALTAETRKRIVAATVELHGSVGPARTTYSMIAERAGVQRHTLYAHFPDEGSLFEACSGLVLERDPQPDPNAWAGIERPRKRLKAGLGALYDWYGRNAGLLAAVLRDAEWHAPTREILARRHGPIMAAYARILGERLDRHQLALLHLALAFPTWRALVLESGLDPATAVELMAEAIFGKK
ncbi:TetR family transcriptional regulator [Dongia mobilis]|uniref:TetR family transcriptional regulator n=1 Tax=Dongia mobilis TaxID=578943 RepID=A0A4R6WM68_9PROT|nr:TetR/AcrR family transcriptional regulator [Dongia mobilis]TDQ81943.1 TetR family transcriptional regulator [Dongia mobilis]